MAKGGMECFDVGLLGVGGGGGVGECIAMALHAWNASTYPPSMAGTMSARSCPSVCAIHELLSICRTNLEAWFLATTPGAVVVVVVVEVALAVGGAMTAFRNAETCRSSSVSLSWPPSASSRAVVMLQRRGVCVPVVVWGGSACGWCCG